VEEHRRLRAALAFSTQTASGARATGSSSGAAGRPAPAPKLAATATGVAAAGMGTTTGSGATAVASSPLAAVNVAFVMQCSTTGVASLTTAQAAYASGTASAGTGSTAGGGLGGTGTAAATGASQSADGVTRESRSMSTTTSLEPPPHDLMRWLDASSVRIDSDTGVCGLPPTFLGFDLVLMDLHLAPGGLDGYATTAFIRQVGESMVLMDGRDGSGQRQPTDSQYSACPQTPGGGGGGGGGTDAPGVGGGAGALPAQSVEGIGRPLRGSNPASAAAAVAHGGAADPAAASVQPGGGNTGGGGGGGSSCYACRVPIIAMTGAVGAAEEARTVGAGMQGFLSKPLQREELLRVIGQWGDTWDPVFA
jgi:CheY-like chemotaxis protein